MKTSTCCAVVAMVVMGATGTGRATEVPTETDLMLLPDQIGVLSIVDATFDGEFSSRPSWPIVARYVYTRVAGQPLRYDAELTCERTADRVVSCDKGEQKKRVGGTTTCFGAESKLERASVRWIVGGLDCALFAQRGSVLEAQMPMKAAVEDAISRMASLQHESLPPASRAEHTQRIRAARLLAKRQPR